MSQVTLEIGSGNSCNHGLFACKPEPIAAFWYNITSIPPDLGRFFTLDSASLLNEGASVLSIVKEMALSCIALFQKVSKEPYLFKLAIDSFEDHDDLIKSYTAVESFPPLL